MANNMMRVSLDPKREHLSPLGSGKNHEGFTGIDVDILYWPEEMAFKRMVYKAVMASRGSSIDSEEYDEKVVTDAFSGGLNQCLEWVTVVFEISGVSRGLTHELVRTRKASFAQQTMRHTNMGNPDIRMPEEIAFHKDTYIRKLWLDAVEMSRTVYRVLVNSDVPYQDARTVLPIGTETYVVASYPLSVFLQTYAYRACYMMYPEIVYLFRRMKDVLLDACPWLEPFVKVSCEKEPHCCTFQGWERVEGHCPLPWAKEDNRVWKSSRFET